MFAKFATSLSTRLKRWIPEPFVFACGLTIIVALLAWFYTDSTVIQIIDHWYQGFWILLEFAMQMVLILATGYAIALSPSVSRMLDRLALLAQTPTKVYLLILFIGALFCLVSWGWIVLTAVLARELAKRVAGVDYAYLIACVYISSQLWVSGLSSSIPLLLNTQDNFLLRTGVLQDLIPIQVTLGSMLNMGFIAMYFVIIPMVMWRLRPSTNSVQSLNQLVDSTHQEFKTIHEEASTHAADNLTPSDRMNNSRWMLIIIALAALWWVICHFAEQGFDINLNTMVFLFFAVGLLLHQTPLRYTLAMKRACSNISGIVFQYPFYAGIMGIMMYSGLGAQLSEWLAQGATLQSLPFVAQMSAALINFAIPSAGGEWAVVGPALTETALRLTEGMPSEQSTAYVARIAMAVAYGETSTNLLQPFFLLTILPIMGAGVKVNARDVMGYLVLPFLVITMATALLVTFVPFY